MCIRDRSRIVDADIIKKEDWTIYSIYNGNVDLINFFYGVPVSYTHLRAHETVLDLVCRLLLEKKKQYTTITQHST